MNQSEEIEQLKEKNEELADQIKILEEEIDADNQELSSWEEQCASLNEVIDGLKSENERNLAIISALFKAMPEDAVLEYMKASHNEDLARYKAEQAVIEAARKQVALTNEMNCFEPVPPIFDLEKAVEALDTIGQEAPNTQEADNG